MQEASQKIAELDASHDEARSAFQDRDLAAYRDLFAPQLKYHQPDGRTIDRDRLMRDVADQFRRVNRVECSFARDQIEIGEDWATEILTQTGSVGVTVFLIVHRTWNLFRRGRYTWRRFGGRWQIEEVEVLEERVSPGRLEFGLRPPRDS